MCSQKTKRKINASNCLVITLLSIAGLTADGFQPSDALFLLATVIWIWQPNLEVLEHKLVDAFNRGN